MDKPRLLWAALEDGRSVVAGCAPADLERLLADPHSDLTLTADDSVEVIPGSEVRFVRVFDARADVPHATVSYRLARV